MKDDIKNATRNRNNAFVSSCINGGLSEFALGMALTELREQEWRIFLSEDYPKTNDITGMTKDYIENRAKIKQWCGEENFNNWYEYFVKDQVHGYDVPRFFDDGSHENLTKK